MSANIIMAEQIAEDRRRDAEHDRRVTELLNANNLLVERERAAKCERDALVKDVDALRPLSLQCDRLTAERDAAVAARVAAEGKAVRLQAEKDAAVAARVAAEGKAVRLQAEKDAAVCILAARSMECAGCCGPSAKEHERPGYLDEARKDIEEAALAATGQGDAIFEQRLADFHAGRVSAGDMDAMSDTGQGRR